METSPDILPTLELGPEGNEASGAVVWLHGLGADGHDFEPIVPSLGCPNVRFVFPHAPKLAVTINGGFEMPAWYDILTLDENDGRENAEHVLISAKRVEALLDRELDRGISPDRLVLAGFSQGAAMALHVAPRYGKQLAGIIALSGYQVMRDKFAEQRTTTNQATPMFFGHGSQDPVVKPAWGRAAFDAFAGWSEASVTWEDYPMGHQVCTEEISDIARWLKERLP